jgi:hypothetical protein
MVNISEGPISQAVGQMSGFYLDTTSAKAIHQDEKTKGPKLLFVWLIAILGSWSIAALIFWTVYRSVAG